jgi:hypothetical protein
MTRIYFAILALLMIAAPAAAQTNAGAQTNAQNASELRLVIVDETGAGIPAATVTVTPAAGEPITFMGDDRGRAISPALAPGQVTIVVDYPGFEPVSMPLTLRRGAVNQTITLKIAGLTDEVVVNDTTTDITQNTAATTQLSQAEIDALPDNEEDLRAYLEQLAGPGGATFLMNGFRGGRLPTREEIRAIRIRQNSFAADAHESGRSSIEIVTRPSTELGGNLNFGFKGDNWNARNALAKVETPEGEKNAQVGVRGPIVKGRTAFRFNGQANNSFASNTIIARDEQTLEPLGTQARALNERQNFNVALEHSLTGSQSLYVEFQGQQQHSTNNGVGGFNLPERATTRDTDSQNARFRVQGVIGKTMLHETRFELNRNYNEISSVTEAPAIIIQDFRSTGGAGQSNHRTTGTWEFADNLDFSVGRRHQMRVGLLVESGLYDTFDEQNKHGTWTYRDIDMFRANKPLQFTRRIGTVDTSFRQYQFGVYFQDDWRVNNKFTIGYGVRNEMQSHISDKLNIMPRVGFTWTVARNTAVRGGYGIYYDWYDASLYDTTLRLNGISQTDETVRYEYDADGNQIGTPQVLSGGRTQAAADLDMPLQHQVSLGVERQLRPNWSVGVTYQMQRGINVFRARDINTPVNGVRPNGTGIITQFDSDGKSETDRVSFQSRVQIPSLRGFFQVSYNLGRSNGYGGATSLPMDSLNPNLDWGPTGQDIRHQFQVGGQLPLVFGVRMQAQLNAQSGPAYNITTGVDTNRDGVLNDRPDGVTRNAGRGEGYWNVQQLRLMRQFSFGSRGQAAPRNQQQGGGNRGGGNAGNFNQNARYSVEMFVNAQNPLNRVIPTGYSGNLSVPSTFGLPTNVQQARRVNFGMSLRF